MTPQEANKIIADYMGWNVTGMVGNNSFYIQDPQGFSYSRALFTESLDALVPVWEKLPIIEQSQRNWSDGYLFRIDYWTGDKCDKNWLVGQGKTIQEAAAIATAKAIQELEK